MSVTTKINLKIDKRQLLQLLYFDLLRYFHSMFILKFAIYHLRFQISLFECRKQKPNNIYIDHFIKQLHTTSIQKASVKGGERRGSPPSPYRRKCSRSPERSCDSDRSRRYRFRICLYLFKNVFVRNRSLRSSFNDFFVDILAVDLL